MTQPSLCKIRVILRAIVMLHLILGIYDIAVSATFSLWLGRFYDQLVVAWPSLFAFFVICCPLLRLPGTQREPVQFAIAMVVAALVNVAVIRFIMSLPFPTSWAGWLPWRAALVAMALACVFMWYLRLENRLLRHAETQIRLNDLQNRIRPHFLFNALNSASAMVRSDPAQAEHMIENLAELFRNATMRKHDTHPLAEELKLCQRYLEVERTRFGERMKLHWEVQPGVERVTVPALSIQPLLENAVKHGLEALEGDCHISVRIRKRLTQLIVEVSNTAPPPNPHAAKQGVKKGAGIALDNIRERLKLLYDMNAKFEHKQVGSQHLARLALPL